MSAKPRVLVLQTAEGDRSPLVERFSEEYNVTLVRSAVRAMALWRQGGFAGVFVDAGDSKLLERVGLLVQADQILDAIPDGVALVGSDLRVEWANRQFQDWSPTTSPVGQSFYEALGSPEILGPEFSPFHTAVDSGRAATTTLRRNDNRYFHVTATPVRDTERRLEAYLIALVREITSEVLQQQKIAAIHQAGSELANIAPEELAEMSVNERIELLKANIVRHTKDLLNFDTIELRLLDKQTNKLEPLLAVGMSDVAADRELFAEPHGNGVTGFVAATCQSYLCEDAANDPLYLPGAPGARSSLTVPLVLHDEVIGTFNVESPEPGAFSESDLQFLDLFARDVAMALGTLELLVAEKMTTANESIEAIGREVALPVDQILSDAVWVLEKYIGHEPEVAEHLRRILNSARNVKQVIQKVGEKMRPAVPHPPVPLPPERPALKGRRVLVADQDESVRRAAHALLERYGCMVETARDAGEAIAMARISPYDVILADIRLPDMTGYDCFRRLREVQPTAPVALMTAFGYDPSHSLVKARQEGLKTVLYKPFRMDRLLAAVEEAIAIGPPSPAPTPEPASTAEAVAK